MTITDRTRPTLEDLRRLPATVTLPVAGQFHGLDRSRSYRLNAQGEFPCPVHRRGERFVVLTAELAASLGVDARVLFGDPTRVSDPHSI